QEPNASSSVRCALRSAWAMAARTVVSASARSVMTPALSPRERRCPMPRTRTRRPLPGCSGASSAAMMQATLLVPMSSRPTISAFLVSTLSRLSMAAFLDLTLRLIGGCLLRRGAHGDAAAGTQVDNEIAGCEQVAELVGRRQRGKGASLALGTQMHYDAVLQVQRPAAAADALGHLEALGNAREAHDELEQRLRLLGRAGTGQARQLHVGAGLERREHAAGAVDEILAAVVCPQRRWPALGDAHFQRGRVDAADGGRLHPRQRLDAGT